MKFLNFELFTFGNNIKITVGSIVLILLGFVFARIINFIISRLLKSYFKKRNVDIGRSYTVITLLKYLIYLLIFVSVINLIGIKLTYLLAGSAALLVGVGLGLQKTFNDFFSGIILLVDGSIEVGDILMVNGKLARVKFIGLRTSKLENLNKHIIIIPNSDLVSNQIDNLTQQEGPVRLEVNVSVNYKSDIQKVERVLLEAIEPFSKFKMNYTPAVFLDKFGTSSVDFKLFFFTDDAFRSEKLLSDVRKEVFKALLRAGIEIPFPQQDIWIKNEVKTLNEYKNKSEID